MTRLHIEAILRDVSTWQAMRDKPVSIAFERVMRSISYGPEETIDAWYWFMLGYAHGLSHV